MRDEREVGETLETLADHVRALRESTDARFDEVTDALVEQRRYTEFAFETLRAEMAAGFADVRRDVKFDLAGLRTELKDDIREVRADLAGVRSDVQGLRTDVDALKSGFGVLDRKLDRVLDHLSARRPRRRS